jgi:hypothetical protein
MRRVKAPTGASDILYGEAPFGWRLSRNRSRLVLDGDEQRIIAVVRHMYFARRLPMREIVNRLREMGIINRRGKPFGLSSVWEMTHRSGERPPEARGGKPPKARRPRDSPGR